VRIGLDIKKLELGALDVAAYGHRAVGGVEALLVLGLPGGGGPEVGGEGEWQRMGDVPDEFVLTGTGYSHGVVHLYFVEGVGRVDFVPTCCRAAVE